MSYRHRPSALRFSPFIWVKRGLVVILVVFALLLFVLHRADTGFSHKLQNHISGFFQPFVTAIAAPGEAFGDLGAWFANMRDLREDHAVLKQEHAQLLEWQRLAKELQAENAALRKLLHYDVNQKEEFVIARVVAAANAPYADALMVNVGADEGVAKYQAVMSDKSLIGRVIQTKNHRAWVLLLSDVNSRIPVTTNNSRERAILRGDGNGEMSLRFLGKNHGIKAGEEILSASDGDVLPAGLPVGVVGDVSEHMAEVTPYHYPHHIDYVKLLAMSQEGSEKDNTGTGKITPNTAPRNPSMNATPRATEPPKPPSQLQGEDARKPLKMPIPADILRGL